MRYRLRTLMIVLALGPPIVAWQYSRWRDDRLWRSLANARQERDAALVAWRTAYEAATRGTAPQANEAAASDLYFKARKKVEDSFASLRERYGDDQGIVNADQARRRKP